MKKKPHPYSPDPSSKNKLTKSKATSTTTANFAAITPKSDGTLLIKIRFILFLISLTTPVIYSTHTFFGYISERTWFINAVIELMFLFAIFSPHFFTSKLSNIQLSVLLFLISLLLADSFGVDPIQSFFSGYSRMEGFLLYLHLALYFFSLARLPFPRNYWNIALLVSVLISIIVVLKGYFSTTGWQSVDHRFIATIGNPSFLAGYLLLNFFLTIYLRTQFNSISKRIKFILGFFALTILFGGIYFTGTRSAIIGLVTGVVFIAICTVWRQYSFSIYNFGRLSLIFIFFVSLFWLARATPLLQQSPFLYRLTHYSGVNNTLTPRLVCWKIALRGIAERPFLGWGQETFSYGFAQHYDPAILLSSDYSWYDRAHNVLLDLSFSAGAIGLLAYLFIWLNIARRLYSPKTVLTTRESIAIGAVFIAYFFFNLFNFDCLLTLQSIFLLLAFIDLNYSNTSSSELKPTLLYIIRITGVFVIVFLGIYSVFQPYRSLRLLDQQNKITDIQQRVQALEEIYHQATGRQLDMVDNLVSLTLSVLQSNQPLPTKQYCYQRATALMEEQLAIHSMYTRLMTRLVSLYVAGGEIDKAIALSIRINTIEGSKRPPALIQLGNAYLNKREFSQALTSFEQAHQLYPSWEEPVLYKAFTYAIQQDTTQCFPLLRSISTQTLSNRLGFIKQIYSQSGHPQEFLNRLMLTKQKELYPPSVYLEWVLSAFDLHDRTQTYTAINSYYNMYLTQRLTYGELKQLLKDTDMGIRPDRLTSITEAIMH